MPHAGGDGSVYRANFDDAGAAGLFRRGLLMERSASLALRQPGKCFKTRSLIPRRAEPESAQPLDSGNHAAGWPKAASSWLTAGWKVGLNFGLVEHGRVLVREALA